MPMWSVIATMSSDGRFTLKVLFSRMPLLVRWMLPIPSVMPLRWAMPTCAIVAKSGVPSTVAPMMAVTSG